MASEQTDTPVEQTNILVEAKPVETPSDPPVSQLEAQSKPIDPTSFKLWNPPQSGPSPRRCR